MFPMFLAAIDILQIVIYDHFLYFFCSIRKILYTNLISVESRTFKNLIFFPHHPQHCLDVSTLANEAFVLLFTLLYWKANATMVTTNLSPYLILSTDTFL